MPFPQSLSYSSPYLGPSQISGRTHAALNELVQQTIFKPSIKSRREAVTCEEGVGSCFLLAVYEHIGPLAICPQQYRILIYLVFGQTG